MIFQAKPRFSNKTQSTLNELSYRFVFFSQWMESQFNVKIEIAISLLCIMSIWLTLALGIFKQLSLTIQWHKILFCSHSFRRSFFICVYLDFILPIYGILALDIDSKDVSFNVMNSQQRLFWYVHPFKKKKI